MPPIDYEECARAGAIGGVGAIPGTMCAHPCDVVKMRQQLTGEGVVKAVRGVYGGGVNRGGGRTERPLPSRQSVASLGLGNFFAGSVPAVQQKVATRSGMFLASSASCQSFESRLGFDPTSAAFAGSAASGYLTGAIASPWEWQKVLASQRVNSPATGKGWVALLSEARRHHGFLGGIRCVGRRAHAAGVRNAVFDSTFFGTKRILEERIAHRRGIFENSSFPSTGFAYGAAAIVAVSVDYAIDVAVKRIYGTGTECAIPAMGVLRHTLFIVSKEGKNIFRGLGTKSVEFGISYMITGLVAPHIARAADGFIKDENSSRQKMEDTK